ncbi:type II toxin-antitoxin system Phd/YefM family antitoxin [Photobacterium profundum]|nr:type II toxin-antitoxin system Phd/YefM family antitoxin [Photobacterium profundum]
MDSISVNRFRANLKSFVENVIGHHAPIKVTRRSGEDFIAISVEDRRIL